MSQAISAETDLLVINEKSAKKKKGWVCGALGRVGMGQGIRETYSRGGDGGAADLFVGFICR